MAFGDLMVRGPWVTAGYYRGEGGSVLRDGWFPTGDVATLDADGYVQITDRSKDVIKSGGEWIGSIDLENIAMAHPCVAMAACIAAEHKKWDERPLLVVVKKPGSEVTREELIAFGRTEPEIAREIGCDELIYQDLAALREDVGSVNPKIVNFEDSCFSGVYVTGDVTQAYLDDVEAKRRDGVKMTQIEEESGQLDLGLETV